MIFFSEKKLARKLHEGQVTEKEQMIYLLLSNLFVAFASTSVLNHFLYYETPLTMYDYVIDLLILLVTIALVLITAYLNNKGDNKELIFRFVCLGVPIGIKAVFIVFFAGFFIGLIEELIDGGSPEKADNSANASGLIMFALVYMYVTWRYKVAFQIASGRVELK